MGKWKVNREKINNDIPGIDGNIEGFGISYSTKRMVIQNKIYDDVSKQTETRVSREKETSTVPLPESEVPEGKPKKEPIGNPYKGMELPVEIQKSITGVESRQSNKVCKFNIVEKEIIKKYQEEQQYQIYDYYQDYEKVITNTYEVTCYGNNSSDKFKQMFTNQIIPSTTINTTKTVVDCGFTPITLKINFHEPKQDNKIITTKTFVIMNEIDYNNFLSNNLSIVFDSSDIPTQWSKDGYVDAPIGFWVVDKFWNNNEKRVIQEGLTDNDKLGSEDNPFTNIFNKYVFGDKNEIDVYPFLGAVDVNYIVITYTMSTKDEMIREGIWGNNVGQLTTDLDPKDLDTQTYITDKNGEQISSYSFGYDPNGSKTGIISDDCFTWSGDNTGMGEENCIIFVEEYEHGNKDIGMFNGKKSLTNLENEKYKDYNDFRIVTRGYWWHGADGYEGALAKLTISLYKGGKIEVDGYKYKVLPLGNENNLIKQFTTPWRPIKTKGGGPGDSELMGVIHYNRKTKTVEVVEPFVVRGTEETDDPYKLKTYEGYYDTSLYDIYLTKSDAIQAAVARGMTEDDIIYGNRLSDNLTKEGEKIYVIKK